MTKSNEAFSRVFIDAQLKDQCWNINDYNCVRYEVVLSSGRADYVLCDRHGRSLAVIEAKRASINPADATEQAKGYAKELNAPYTFLANGDKILFWEWDRDAYPRRVKTFFKQDDLERRAATRQVRRDPLTVPIDNRIAGGKHKYQTDCIERLCREIGQGRRKLLVDMATGTGNTRTAAAPRGEKEEPTSTRQKPSGMDFNISTNAVSMMKVLMAKYVGYFTAGIMIHRESV